MILSLYLAYQIYYVQNKSDIIYYPIVLVVIFMHDRIKIAKEFAETIKSDDIKLIMLFGSVARGDDNEESDIDILIVSPIADKIKPEINSEKEVNYVRKMS